MSRAKCVKGFTRLENDILEALARIRIPGEARQVLDVIIRKTWGFGKEEDKIALSQFHLATGLLKPSVVRAIRLLESMRIIYKKAIPPINSYRINKDYSSWKPLTKKLTINKKANNHLQKCKSNVSENVTYNRNNTKETITKETFPLDSNEIRLVNLLLKHILNRLPNFKKPDIQEWAKDIALMIRRDNRTSEEIEKVIEWCQQDHFWCHNILSTGSLQKHYDTLASKMHSSPPVGRNCELSSTGMELI